MKRIPALLLAAALVLVACSDNNPIGVSGGDLDGPATVTVSGRVADIDTGEEYPTRVSLSFDALTGIDVLDGSRYQLVTAPATVTVQSDSDALTALSTHLTGEPARMAVMVTPDGMVRMSVSIFANDTRGSTMALQAEWPARRGLHSLKLDLQDGIARDGRFAAQVMGDTQVFRFECRDVVATLRGVARVASAFAAGSD